MFRQELGLCLLLLICPGLLWAQEKQASKRLGIDANYVVEMEARGHRWTVNGAAVDPFQLFAKAGANACRVRLWTGNEGTNGLQDATAAAKRAQAAGLVPYLVLFLSENWADLMKQPAPLIWKDLTFEDKLKAIEAYTERVAGHFAQEGVEIGLYEIGNEVDFGIAGEFEEEWPKRVSLEYMSNRIWPRIAAIAKAAEAGVRKSNPDAKFTMHLARWEETEYGQAYWKFMLEQGVQLDYLGLSYYPTATTAPEKRPLAFLSDQLHVYQRALGRPILICEYAFPAESGFDGQFADWQKPVNGYEFTAAGQAKWLTDFLALARGEEALAGAFYWSPEWYDSPIWHAFSLFTAEGAARPAVGAFGPEAAAAEVNVYFGNLHSHTSASDGTGSAADAFAHARDVAKLDFLAVTEHNHLLGGDKASPEVRHGLYTGPDAGAVVPAADAANQDGQFVAIYGQEYSSMSKGNHVNVFDVREVIDVPNGDFAGLLNWLRANPDSSGRDAIVQFNHPALGYRREPIGPKEYGRDDFGDMKGWIEHMGPVTSLIEVLNGEPAQGAADRRSPQIMDDYFPRYLQLGFHLAPTGDQDNHQPTWGDATDTRTGVLAPALTRAALLQALRDRHCYATEDKNLRLIFKVQGHLCGDILEAPGPLENLAISYQIADNDEPEAAYTIDVYQGAIGGKLAEIVQTVQLAPGDPKTGEFKGPVLSVDGAFLYFRITQTGGAIPDRSWTAPVWLKVAPPPQ